MQTRSLKVENVGDFLRCKTHPKIRLEGKWLAELGFPADSRVLVVPVALGEMILRAESRTFIATGQPNGSLCPHS